MKELSRTSSSKKVQVNNDKVFVLDKTSKKKKLNTPMKAKDCARSLCFDTSMSSDDYNNESLMDSDSTLNDLISLLPMLLRT